MTDKNTVARMLASRLIQTARKLENEQSIEVIQSTWQELLEIIYQLKNLQFYLSKEEEKNVARSI